MSSRTSRLDAGATTVYMASDPLPSPWYPRPFSYQPLSYELYRPLEEKEIREKIGEILRDLKENEELPKAKDLLRRVLAGKKGGISLALRKAIREFLSPPPPIPLPPTSWTITSTSPSTSTATTHS